MRRVACAVVVLLASLLLIVPAAIHPLDTEPVYLPIALGEGATPTPTAGTPAPQDLHLSGLVYDATGGPGMPIPGAHVSALVCVPRAFHTVTGPDGRYALFVPSSYAFLCSQLTLQVSAPGYVDLSERADVADLAAHPARDFALVPLATPTATRTLARAPTWGRYAEQRTGRTIDH